MLRTVASCLLLLSALPAAAETLLGAPSYDTVAETTHRQLYWQDFKGKGQAPSDAGRWGTGRWANVAVSHRFTEFEAVTEAVTEGASEGFVARPEGLRVYAVLDKFRSAVQHGAHADQTLAHEQAHFDLGEAMARRLTVELMSLRGHGGNAGAAERDLRQKAMAAIEEGFVAMMKMQQDYDGETAHGAKRKQQKKWLEKIAELFAEATAELAARLDGPG